MVQSWETCQTVLAEAKSRLIDTVVGGSWLFEAEAMHQLALLLLCLRGVSTRGRARTLQAVPLLSLSRGTVSVWSQQVWIAGCRTDEGCGTSNCIKVRKHWTFWLSVR